MGLKTFTTRDGASLSYADEGQGPALVLLSGWSQSAAMYRHQIAHFSRSRRVVALDHRGHGLSPRASGGYRIHRLAADLLELLDHANIPRATLVGSSMGCSVIWAFIDLYGTDRIERLVFIDEPASVMKQAGMGEQDIVDAGALFDAATMLAIAGQILGPEGNDTRGAFLGSMITKAIPDDLKAFLLEENLRVLPSDLATLFVHHCSLDWRDVFARIDRPTLVIGGRVSHVDHRSQIWIHQQIAGSELVIFAEAEGGAHFPFIEAPGAFNAVLERFLDGKERD